MIKFASISFLQIIIIIIYVNIGWCEKEDFNCRLPDKSW